MDVAHEGPHYPVSFGFLQQAMPGPGPCLLIFHLSVLSYFGFVCIGLFVLPLLTCSVVDRCQLPNHVYIGE